MDCVEVIEAKAIRKLKHPSRSRVLRGFLDNTAITAASHAS
jgi:hypothetical protein